MIKGLGKNNKEATHIWKMKNRGGKVVQLFHTWSMKDVSDRLMLFKEAKDTIEREMVRLFIPWKQNKIELS